jgi:ferric-dicitrate binding protein FerR (iron transport regulator)
MSTRPPPRIDESHPNNYKRVFNHRAVWGAANDAIELDALRAIHERRISIRRARQRRRRTAQAAGVALALVVFVISAALSLWGVWLAALAGLVLLPLVVNHGG